SRPSTASRAPSPPATGASPLRARVTCWSCPPPAPTATRWRATTTRYRARRSSSAATARRGRSSAARHSRTSRSVAFRVGLLGRGTVGAAFSELLEERAPTIEAAIGQRPEISGVLTRSEGDFDEVVAGSDLVVELIGGVEP